MMVNLNALLIKLDLSLKPRFEKTTQARNSRTLQRVKLFKCMTIKHSAVLDLFRNLYRWDPVHAEYQLAQLDTCRGKGKLNVIHVFGK